MNTKKTIEKVLRFMARGILWKYDPIVIGVTGSVGKTTTKDAIAHALFREYRLRKSNKNYNNEIGVPLTILGVETAPGRSVYQWIALSIRWILYMIFPLSYPQVLVLEMAVDRKGDMRYLLSIVQPDISIVTSIASSHLEFFGSVKAIAQEKSQILRHLSSDGWAVINEDNAYCRAMKKKTRAQTVSFGFGEKSDLRAFQEVVIQDEKEVQGMHLKLEYQGKVVPIQLDNIIAQHHLYAVLAAFSVASCMKMNLIDIAQNMKDFSLPPGRLQLLPGQQGSWIVDDSYNASPESMLAALETFSCLSTQRKIVVLGDMLELGEEEEEGHRNLAKSIIEQNVAYVVLMGSRMKFLKDELEKNGYSRNQLFLFSSPVQAGQKVRALLKRGDYVLIKGSQGARMEKVVEQVVEDTSQASNFLCRQDARWKEIPFKPL